MKSNKQEWSLNRTEQCAKCPWKISTNPLEIPDGYSIKKHKDLNITISDGSFNVERSLNIMACHESRSNEPEHCIGWLNNQLGRGNNIALRLKMISCSNSREIKIVGEQHKCFKDTLPSEP